jgi:rhomboid family GlyGly-CTERM serine protease
MSRTRRSEHLPLMRLNSAIGLPLVVVLIVAAELLSLGNALEYRRAAAFSEPWRLLTGHFVHLSLLHALLNGVALLLIGRLFADRLKPAEIWMLLLAGPVVISIVFWSLLPELQWYRGLSDVLHSIYFAGCVVWVATTTGRARWLPIAALLVGSLKVLIEQPWDSSFPVHEVLRVAVVPQAHLIGAIVGGVSGIWLALRRRDPPAVRERI